MFCESCGSQISEGESFCSNCGQPVAQQTSTPAPAPAPVAAQPVYQQSAYQQPAYQQPVYQQSVYQQPVYQQPVYQQPVYQQPYYQPAYTQPMPVKQPVERVPNGAATAGLVLGILTMVFCWVPILNILTGIPGMITSIVGIAKRNGKGKAKAIVGLCLSIFGMIIGIFILFVIWYPLLMLAAIMAETDSMYDYDFDDDDYYYTSAPETGLSTDDYYVNGDFVNTDKGYVCGVLHIDGFRVDY